MEAPREALTPAARRTYEDFVKRGRALADRGEPQPAISFYRKALEVHDQSPPLYTALASAYYELDELNNAERNLKLAIRLDRRYAPAHFLLGTVYQSLGRVSEAIEEYERFLVLNPTAPQAKVVRDVIVQLRQGQ